MKRLEEQFKLFTLKLDFPAGSLATVESGNHRIDIKLRDCEPSTTIPRKCSGQTKTDYKQARLLANG